MMHRKDGNFVPDGSVSTTDSARRCRRWAALCIVVVSLLRVAYLFLWCPYDLAPDEAHYWDWSRHLDWSYYSKGPLIAWIIRASLELFGSLSVAVHGTMMPALRLPAVLFGALILVALYVLTVQTYRDERLALRVVLVGIAFPPLAVCSIITTIDSPFLCCWAWALVFGRWAVIDGRGWAWPVTGVMILLGILAKYTMALWLFSFGLMLLLTPAYRHLLWSIRFWTMVAVAGLSALPILWWNHQHDWVTFRHVAGQAGVPQGNKNAGIRWFGPLEYVGGQIGLLLIFWFIVWVRALWAKRPNHGSEGERYLWWLSVPTFVLFGLSSIKASGQLNWPVSAYMSGFVLGAHYLQTWFARPTRPDAPLVRRSMYIALTVGGFATLAIHDTRFIGQIIGPLLPEPSARNPMPIRKIDFAARIKGWRYLAGEIDQLRSELQRSEGEDPVLTAIKWDYPGQIGFYTQGQPPVYSLGLIMGDRHSQYDLWHPNPIDDAQVFLGKTFIFVGNWYPKHTLESAFKRVDSEKEIVYRENGHTVARWSIYVCHGFQGFDPTLNNRTSTGH